MYGKSLFNADFNTFFASVSDVFIFFGIRWSSCVPAPIAVIIVRKPTIERSFAKSPWTLLDKKPIKSNT